MKRTSSLKLNKDFRRIYARGKNAAAANIVIYAFKNRRGLNRIGLTVSKKYGNAPERNRIRRLMRESYRLMENEIPKGYDFIFIARGRARGRKLCHIQKDMRYLMGKLAITK